MWLLPACFCHPSGEEAPHRSSESFPFPAVKAPLHVREVSPVLQDAMLDDSFVYQRISRCIRMYIWMPLRAVWESLQGAVEEHSGRHEGHHGEPSIE
eukprot:1143084-Pelagomonas_calceolata.AAC.1